MGIAQYLIGLALGAAAIVPVVIGARTLRRALAPDFAGAGAAVADAVLAVALLVLGLELVGVLGLLHRVGAAAGCAVTGATAWWAARGMARAWGAREPAVTDTPGSPPPRLSHTPAPVPGPRGERPLVLAAVALVAAPWLAWTVFAYGHGMESVDTLWYHLPFAARFTQLGSILHLQYFDADPVTVFYPADSELLHALGLAVFHSDFLSPLVNLGWAALALVSGWAIGRPRGRSGASVLGVLIVLGTPGLVVSQPGGGYNDVVCVALLLAAAAVLVTSAATHGTPQRGPSAIAAVAAGLALGTKFTMIVPAVLLGLGVVAVAGRGRRGREALVWLGGLVGLGGYWYGRNWVTAGNPVPSLALHLGPLSLPAPHVSTPTFTVAQYLFNGTVWQGFFIPGLRESLGPAWWALLAGPLLGALPVLVGGRDRIVRLLGGLTLLGVGAFLLTPQFLGLPGLPVFFVDNVRYLDSALALGLAVAPLAPVFAGRRAYGLLLTGLGIALVATELDPAVWPVGLDLRPISAPVSGAPAVAGALLGVAGFAVALAAPRLRGFRPRVARLGRAPALALGAVALAVAGGLIARHYAARAYTRTSPLPVIYRWARSEHGQRIGIDGFDLQYPLSGQGATNYVQFIGAGAPHAGFHAITSCATWRAAVNRGHYGWLVITPAGFPFGTASAVAAQTRWLAGQPVRIVRRERGAGGAPAVLYRVTGRLAGGPC